MCFHSKQTKKAQKLEHKFNAKIENIDVFTTSKHYNGFSFPKTPVITNEDVSKIQMMHWGLHPNWAQDDFNKTFTLNARIETLSDKKSFKNILNNRCVILVNGFYEWQHIKNQKVKYDIGFNDELFALAGIFDKNNSYKSYSVITTKAQGVMCEIHNTKLRMPLALNSKKQIESWLQGDEVMPSFNFSAIAKSDFQTSLF
ncbi:MAG: SOS response-associated peptidase family protein [Flavobacteriaceae bacterium]